jgi:hypothetical protein
MLMITALQGYGLIMCSIVATIVVAILDKTHK